MKKLNVAIVDDEVDMLEVMRLFFEDEMDFSNYHFYFFSSGAECLKHIDKIDYLVSDINMPGMDGYQLVKEAKNLSPQLRASLMSAYGGDEYKQKAEAIGVEEYFVKPLDIEAIKKRLEKAFGIY
jgi:two-component system response regulator YesN